MVPEQFAYDRIRETLRESVRMHMRADVPVGAFLSSGIDSTAVVAAMAAMRISGAVPTMLSLLWCSETQ